MSKNWDRDFLDGLACHGDPWLLSFLQTEIRGSDGALNMCRLGNGISYAPLFALYAYSYQHPFSTQGRDAAMLLFGKKKDGFRDLWDTWRDQDYNTVWLPFIQGTLRQEVVDTSGDPADIHEMDRKAIITLLKLKMVLLCLDACQLKLPHSEMERCGVLLTEGWDYTLQVKDTQMVELLQRLDPQGRGPWKIHMQPNV